MAKATHAREVRAFTDIPNVGRAMMGDFQRLGFTAPAELAGEDPYALYQRMCAVSGARQDPCVLDTYMAVVEFMNGGAPKPWWSFTAERKKRFPDL